MSMYFSSSTHTPESLSGACYVIDALGVGKLVVDMVDVLFVGRRKKKVNKNSMHSMVEAI